MFAGHGHLGAMPATVCDELWDATTFGTLNFGGSTATTVSFVVSSPRGM
jgi:hypothetical protein